MRKVRMLETINLLRKHDLGVPYFSLTYKWLACQQGIDTRRLTLHPPPLRTCMRAAPCHTDTGWGHPTWPRRNLSTKGEKERAMEKLVG